MTKTVLKLEHFDNVHYAQHMGHNKSTCWIAQLTGLDDRYGFAREFVRGQRDWSQAKMTGSRGIYVYYPLDPGIYEVNERESWKHVRRFFIRVSEDGGVSEIDRSEVISCLTNDTSE